MEKVYRTGLRVQQDNQEYVRTLECKIVEKDVSIDGGQIWKWMKQALFHSA